MARLLLAPRSPVLAQKLRENFTEMIIAGFDHYLAAMDIAREDLRQRNPGGFVPCQRRLFITMLAHQSCTAKFTFFAGRTSVCREEPFCGW